MTARKLFSAMTHTEAAEAIRLARGRNWSGADSFAVTDFGDCARSEFYWSDGAAAYMLHDSKAEALDHLRKSGANV